MKLSEIRETLDVRGIQLTKSLGQNFLHDQNQLNRIAEAADLTQSDKVLEIGPGLGPLTELLVARAQQVQAIEKDARLVEVLRTRFAAHRNLDLQHADALDVVRDRRRDWQDWKLVANLPYSVASPILVELAQNPRRPERMVVTLQLEVAKRLMAKVADEDYGVLTLLLQLRYEPKQWFKIPRGCFFPEPDVDSACVVLLRREKALLAEDQHTLFETLMKRAFSQRRKKMAKLLRGIWWRPEDINAALAELKLPADVRGEKLSLEQFIALTKILSENWTRVSRPASQMRMSEEIFDVVNERDEIIGRETRREVHRTGLKHRAVHVFVFNQRGEVFLQKRSMSKDSSPGLWDSSASGHLDCGEQYDDCAIRELREEIGLIVNARPQRLFKVAACTQTAQEFIWLYQCESEGPFTLHPDEIELGDWFASQQVSNWVKERPHDFAPAFVLLWNQFTHGSGNAR